MFFVILYRFFPCFVNVCFILKQKWGRMLHPNAGSHPHAGLAPQKMNYKEEENKYIFQSREGMDGTLVCSNFAKICSVEILIFCNILSTTGYYVHQSFNV